MLNTKIQVVDNLPNILLNSNFEIDQRFTGNLASGNDQYTVDRWRIC